MNLAVEGYFLSFTLRERKKIERMIKEIFPKLDTVEALKTLILEACESEFTENGDPDIKTSVVDWLKNNPDTVRTAGDIAINFIKAKIKKPPVQ